MGRVALALILLSMSLFCAEITVKARTGPQKYLTEIVHDNPAWINAATAKKLGIKSGDTIEIATFRQKAPLVGKNKKRRICADNV